MGALGRLYPLNNKTIKKTINIEDKLYQRLLEFVKSNYDATFSDIVNVCIEDGVRIDIWTHFMRECIINYVH